MAPDDLRDLSPDELRRILDTLATGRYGTRWQAALAREFAYSRRAVHTWANEGKPPLEMIIALHHLQQPAQLAEIAKLARLAKLTAERLDSEVSRFAPPTSAG